MVETKKIKAGKLLKISDQRSIYIIQNEDESYIDKDFFIKYRNIGPSFEIKMIEEAKIEREKGMILVLDTQGKPKFHFPEVWLDVDYMRIHELAENGKLQIK